MQLNPMFVLNRPFHMPLIKELVRLEKCFGGYPELFHGRAVLRSELLNPLLSKLVTLVPIHSFIKGTD